MRYEVFTYKIRDGVGAEHWTYSVICGNELIDKPHMIYRMYKREITAMNNGMKHLIKHHNKIKKNINHE